MGGLEWTEGLSVLPSPSERGCSGFDGWGLKSTDQGCHRHAGAAPTTAHDIHYFQASSLCLLHKLSAVNVVAQLCGEWEWVSAVQTVCNKVVLAATRLVSRAQHSCMDI